MNFAAVWDVPCVFVLVNNGWAISVPASAQTAAPYAKKAKAYGMPAIEVDGNDVLANYAGMSSAVEAAREGKGPSLVVVNTYRMHGHSSSDDPSKYRDEAEVASWADKDPIDRFEAKLIDLGVLNDKSREQLRVELITEIDAVINEQEAASKMPLKSLVEDVYAEVPHHLRVQYNDFIRIAERLGEATRGDGAFPL